MFNRKNILLIAMFILFVLSGLVGNYLSKITEVPSNLQKRAVKKTFEKPVVSQDTDVFFGTFYLTCNHLIKEQPDTELSGIALSELVKKYSPDEGWVVDTLNPKHIMIYKRKEGLCPGDAAKRHLGVKGDFVAVYRGPVGLNGGIERVTDIRVEELPVEFRAKLREGQLDFANEDELMDALDTIDEYKE